MDYFQKNGIDLSKEQWLVLKYLHEKNGQAQNDLAFITDRSKTSLTRLITTMEKKGLVCRTNCRQDNRVNHIYYTDKGEAIFQKSLPLFNKVIEDLIDGVSSKEIEQTISVLKKIKENAQNKINEINL